MLNRTKLNSRRDLEAAIREAMGLYKARATSDAGAIAARVIPLLVAELKSETELDAELLALAEDWRVLGRRARDLAVELARRVAQQHDIVI